MSGEKYVLAMYDVRGKQDYIFRTNKLKEIVGASWVIRDVFDDYLLKPERDRSTDQKGIFTYDPAHPEENAFRVAAFEQHIKEGYIGEVVYNGGGNFLLLYKDAETFRDVTYRFTKRVMEATGTLRVLGTFVENVSFEDYTADRARLYARHRENEARESKTDLWSCLPIVQVDRKTSMPIVEKDKEGQLTRESRAKRKKFAEITEKIRQNPQGTDYYVSKNEKIFDEIVAKKGEDSQLAVIYIDGNNMGAKVQRATKDMKTYEDCVNQLRKFSATIQKTYVDNGIRNTLSTETDKRFRVVVYAGDEVNIVVPAGDALGCARAYLEQLPAGDSACAGIAVFHSHAPYADAYRIAEEACESGKQKMKAMKLEVASFIDYHICQGAMGVSLEKIRESAGTSDMSLPWMMETKEGGVSGVTSMQDVKRLAGMFQKLGRSNVKGLADAALNSKTELKLELMRIRAHQAEEERKEMTKDWEWLGLGEKDNVDGAQILQKPEKLIYDVVTGFDLWFAEKEEGVRV